MNRLHLKQWPQVSSRFWVRSGFALALGIMAGVGTAAFWALSQQIESAEWLDYSHLLVNELARLETLRTNADVQLQNYLQSGDRNDEATYQDTLQLAQAQLETLQSDTPDNRRHQEWLQRIEQWMGDHTKLASQAIQLRQSNSLQPERQQQLLLQRAILQQKMHRLEAQMIQDIQRDLNEWSTDSSIIARQLQWLTAFGTLVGLDLLVIVNSWLRQAIRNRQQAEQSLWELNRTLEETLQQKTVDLDRMAAAWHTLEQEKEVIDLKLRFFSLASHELRTPLSTILMSAQLLKQAPDWPLEKRERNLDRIQSAART
ncbi:MAG TPA: histidine kinase dimerization/phospho-acceptor domain-containing protein, partial [Stenomitos sp.]